MPLPEKYQYLQTKQPAKRTGAEIQKSGERTQRIILVGGIVLAIVILILVGLVFKYIAFDVELSR